MHAGVLALSQQCLNCADEVLVEVLSEDTARVVGQNAHKHNGIVLSISSVEVLFG